MRLYIFISLLFINISIQTQGLMQGTSIVTPQGLIAVEALDTNDRIMSPEITGISLQNAISKISSRSAFSAIKLQISGIILVLANAQLLYCKSEEKWIPAYELIPGQTLLCTNGLTVLIEKTEKITQPITLFKIAVKYAPYTFALTEYGILAHT